jgi:hypothetical protein
LEVATSGQGSTKVGIEIQRERDKSTQSASVEMVNRYPNGELRVLANLLDQMATDAQFESALEDQNDQDSPWNSIRDKRAIEISRELLPQFIGTTIEQFFDDIAPAINEDMEMEQSSEQLYEHFRQPDSGYEDLTEELEQDLLQDFKDVWQQIHNRCEFLKGQSGVTAKTIARRVIDGEVLAGQRVNGVMVYMRLNAFINLSQIFEAAQVSSQLGRIVSELVQEGTLDKRYLTHGSDVQPVWVPRSIAIAICQRYELTVVDLEPLFNLDVSNTLDKTLFFEPLKTEPEEEDSFKHIDDFIDRIGLPRDENMSNGSKTEKKKKHSSSIPQK